MEQRKVSRDVDIDVLLEIIKNRDNYKENSENGLVILLNGSWGSGKTTFLKDFKEKVDKEEEIDIFSIYNSYEYDFYDNAYLPFFAAIENKIKLKTDYAKLVKCTTKNFTNGLLSSVYAIINGYIKNKTDIDLDDIRDNMLNIQSEEALNNFEDFKNVKAKFQEKMQKKCKQKTQIFIIDELDRCKPSFAMETLEIVKHFFDIKNCVFIIAVDKLQLQESAKTIYGQEMDSEIYFSKFFDYQFNLYPLNFCDVIDTSDILNMEEIVNKTTEIFNSLNVSLRDSKKIFRDFVSKYKKFKSDSIIFGKEQSIFIIFLLTLKYTDLLFYTELMNGNFNSFEKKIMNDNSTSSINYHKFLSTGIDDRKTFKEICMILSLEINTKYISEQRRNTISFSEIAGESHQKEIANKLCIYIPYIKDGLTYKQTIKEVVN